MNAGYNKLSLRTPSTKVNHRGNKCFAPKINKEGNLQTLAKFVCIQNKAWNRERFSKVAVFSPSWQTAGLKHQSQATGHGSRVYTLRVYGSSVIDYRFIMGRASRVTLLVIQHWHVRIRTVCSYDFRPESCVIKWKLQRLNNMRVNEPALLNESKYTY